MSKKYKQQRNPFGNFFQGQFYDEKDSSHDKVLKTIKKIQKQTKNEMKKLELQKEIKKSKTMFLQFQNIIKQSHEQGWMLLSFVDKNLQSFQVFVGQQVDKEDNFEKYSWYELAGAKVAKEEYQNNQFIKLNLKSGTITKVEQQKLQDEIEASIYLNKFNELDPKKPKNTCYNFLVAILKVHQKEEIFSEKCQKYYDLIKVDTIDQAGQIMQVSLWNEYQKFEFNQSQLIFFQNVQYKEIDGYQYFQTVEKKSIITHNEDILNQLPNFLQIKKNIEKSLFIKQQYDLGKNGEHLIKKYNPNQDFFSNFEIKQGLQQNTFLSRIDLNSQFQNGPTNDQYFRLERLFNYCQKNYK